MSKAEVKRSEVLRTVLTGEITLIAASEELELSYRQTKRLYKRYKEHGGVGLIHGLVGKASNNKLSPAVEEEILRLLRHKYVGFGATLSSEHLQSDDNIIISSESLRLLMKRHDIPRKTRKHNPHRSHRERKAGFGDMLQIDGSFHDWFNTGENQCLMNLIDDATGVNLCLFAEQETTYAAATLLWQWIGLYGVPKEIYSDRKNVYIHNEHPHKLSAFGEMCERLGIRVIAAGSAQAKGRVERSNSTHQDRLIKKMSLKPIKTIEQANEFLAQYLPEHNSRFALAVDHNSHRTAPCGTLADFCYYEETRKINNDWTISYHRQTIQLLKQSTYMPAKSTVIVKTTLDGVITITYRNKNIKYSIIANHKKKGDSSTLQKGDSLTLA